MLHKESSDLGQGDAQKTAWIKFLKFNRKHIKKDQRSKGFSLIELLVTVGIIGVLASVAIPAYNKYRINANNGAVQSEGVNMKKAFEACLAGGGLFATCGSNTIGGAVACVAATASVQNTSTTNGCVVGIPTSNPSKVCIETYKVTGANWAIYCSSYNSATGQWTEQAANPNTNPKGVVSGTLATANTKYCKNDGTCN